MGFKVGDTVAILTISGLQDRFGEKLYERDGKMYLKDKDDSFGYSRAKKEYAEQHKVGIVTKVREDGYYHLDNKSELIWSWWMLKSVDKVEQKNNNKEIGTMSRFNNVAGVTTAANGDVALQKDGKAYQYVKGQYQETTVASRGAIASVTVPVEQLKAGDVVIDPETKRGCFVIERNGNNVKLQDISVAEQIVRLIVQDDITGVAVITKLISVVRLVRDNPTVVPLITRYGEDKTFEAMINQHLRFGALDVQRLECEINPAFAQLELTGAIAALINAKK